MRSNACWRGGDERAGGTRVDTYEFPRALGLNHHLIDSEQVGLRIDVVYAELERILSL